MSAVSPMKGTPPHQIKADPLPERYARGWHCLGLAADYKDGKPHTLNIFGTKLVAFQGASGQLHIVDGYCPHMGADLGTGHIEGDTLVCPFHHWKWGGDGVCKAIPYAKRIPPRARIKSWPVKEENQLLFVWHDHEGNPPPPEVTIPRMEACFSDEWTDWSIRKMVINTNCRELVDNLADMAHFGPVHGSPAVYFCNTFQGHIARQMFRGIDSELLGSGLLADSAYFGPAYHTTRMIATVDGQPMHSILLNCHVPIDQNSFELRFGVMVKKNPQLSEEENQAVAQAYADASQQAFSEDVAIWHSKTRVDNPLLCDGDGPIYQLREWYQQFYMDVADLPADLDKPKVFEWRKEEGTWRELDETPAEAKSKLFDI